ncbi:MAG: hypothetical protein JKX85_14100 [Phycisphaeraceae bacterium]|nr:hypothetical protein [Phycisphaeraceae bacterium]
MAILREHIVRKQELRIATLEKQNVVMLEMMKRYARGAADNNITIGDDSQAPTSASQTQNTAVNVFGQEKLDHINTEKIRLVLDESLASLAIPDAAQTAALKTAQLIYSDPEHLENVTCFLPNKTMQEVLVYTGEGWDIQPVQLVLPVMALKAVDTLFNLQPREEDVDTYGPIMIELREKERKYAKGCQLRAILVRN